MFRIFVTLILLGMTSTSWAETRIPQNQTEIQLGFAPLVKMAAPAVVNIYAKRVVQERQSPFQNDPFFRDMFRDFGTIRPTIQNSLGSGVILTADGYVVSNFHVVGGATDIRVVLNDRREFAARVMLADEESDLAILKLENVIDMPVLTLRNSDEVEVGELVLAIGNPFGIGQTVSSGIVSGLARSGTATGSARGYFLQTDAPINPGNSGGALVDVNGQLIGVNTSILTRSGGSNGIGFAIPASLVAEVLHQAKLGHRGLTRPWAGMTGQALDRDIAESLGLDRPEGIVISALHPQSPYLIAGIQPGDVILAVGNQPVNTPPEMLYRMMVAGLGQEVAVTRYRNGQHSEVRVIMAPASDHPARDTERFGVGDILPGLMVSNINPAVITEFDLAIDASGVVVEEPGSTGRRLGLAPGDKLLQINDQVIHRATDVRLALGGGDRTFTVLYLRGLKQQAIRFRL